MALQKLRSKAIEMRKQGASYSQIKSELKVSKSSLSLWLRTMPLSKKRIEELQGRNPVRIERFRETMRKKRESRLSAVLARVAKDIGPLSKRDIFIAGLFLYWGEGAKTMRACTTVSNTDPAVLKFFLAWLDSLGVPKSRLKVHVHLYKDMNVEKELDYWSKTLGIPRSAFRKPYIKNSSRTGLSYIQRFRHGTCNVLYENRDICEYVLMSLEHIRKVFAGNAAM